LGHFRQVLWWLLAGFSSFLGLLFLLAFYDRFWRWRDCFNELGRCYDPATEQVYLEQAGLAWGSLAGVCLITGILLALGAIRRCR
jgi:hypothetical protein